MLKVYCRYLVRYMLYPLCKVFIKFFCYFLKHLICPLIEIIIKEWSFLLGSGTEVYYQKGDAEPILLGKTLGGDDGFQIIGGAQTLQPQIVIHQQQLSL